MYVSSRQGYKPPVESTGKVKEYTHFASLKYCNGAETFYTYAPSVPYNGEDNNDYVDGKGFCCNDGSLEAAQTRALARAAKNNFQEGDTYEKMQFYYHPDHLGSSSYITNLNGEVVQHIEYVPFGEVFVEERNNISNNPLRRERNGKR